MIAPEDAEESKGRIPLYFLSEAEGNSARETPTMGPTSPQEYALESFNGRKSPSSLAAFCVDSHSDAPSASSGLWSQEIIPPTNPKISGSFHGSSSGSTPDLSAAESSMNSKVAESFNEGANVEIGSHQGPIVNRTERTNKEKLPNYNRSIKSVADFSSQAEDPRPTSATACSSIRPNISKIPAESGKIIDLLDDETDTKPAAVPSTEPLTKRYKLDNPIPNRTALESHNGRVAHMPDWMQQLSTASKGVPRIPGHSSEMDRKPQNTHPSPKEPPAASILQSRYEFDAPRYIDLQGFKPTWVDIIPTAPLRLQSTSDRLQPKRYQLSLLNVNHFTIYGLPTSFDGPPTSISGLRKDIKSIARDHGDKATYERDKESDEGGKWRIPLAAYQTFVTFLLSAPNTRVDGIPDIQLKIASLERARQDKGYPTIDKLIEDGVPRGLAKALAPFQRGGVDFVLEKDGRALIADGKCSFDDCDKTDRQEKTNSFYVWKDMGLGKTMQGIASMSVYRHEWPLLVLCPSGARYHWESEFHYWLGVDSAINKRSEDDAENEEAGGIDEDLLTSSEIHVLTSGKDEVIPHKWTKVVICSYGLAPVLVDTGKLFPGQFRCAIVDESHMLKNKNAKRTALLMPVLNATDRCVLLSGTPALSRPLELWPQLFILGTEQHGWWNSEAEFIEKYVKKGGPRLKAELHTLLTSTVMIRRLKIDILKSLPVKIREKAEIHVLHEEQRKEFMQLLLDLRQGKGALGIIAKQQHEDLYTPTVEVIDPGLAAIAPISILDKSVDQVDDQADTRSAAVSALRLELQAQFLEGQTSISNSLTVNAHQLTPEMYDNLKAELTGRLRLDLNLLEQNRMQKIHQKFPTHFAPPKPPESTRNNALTRLYGLTGDVKVPLVVNMLQRWLADPTKGKLCIFAHHISVLDAIRDHANLNNENGSRSKYIRIDGKTPAKFRQEQITSFQSDPTVRVALLGITAAGVAVTLTASSTVWFAELFWTPALMIQAEDRCHRIGQQAQVKCLYFVAKGTLDDVLWKLIEKKFQDLGEFVEGKEKLKLVVDKTYTTLKELHSLFQSQHAENNDYVEFGDEGVDHEIELDTDIHRDIEAFGEEERQMLRMLDAEDDDGDVKGPKDNDQKVSAAEAAERNNIGQDEDNAICLDDDGEENGTNDGDKVLGESVMLEAKEARTAEVARKCIFSNCRLYCMNFCGPSFGFELILHHGRPVIVRLSEDRIRRLGPDSKPNVGHVIVSLNGHRLPALQRLPQIMAYMQQAMGRPPVELTFAEDFEFIGSFVAYYAILKAEWQANFKAQQRATATPMPVGPDQVIEID
jgi:SNF2 family DNA or RNA helicase